MYLRKPINEFSRIIEALEAEHEQEGNLHITHVDMFLHQKPTKPLSNPTGM